MRFHRIILAALPLLLASCGESSSTITAVPVESTNFAPSLGVNLASSTKTASGLYYREVVVGTGATIVASTPLKVDYVGSLANGTQFDAGTVTAPNNFIRGFSEGLLGMKIGGTRQLIIPSSLGYGTQGSPPVIPPNAVLVFTIVAKAP